VFTGWGTLEFMGVSSASLKEVRVPIWKNQDCQKAIGRNVFNSTLCAGGTRKPADACQVLTANKSLTGRVDQIQPIDSIPMESDWIAEDRSNSS